MCSLLGRIAAGDVHGSPFPPFAARKVRVIVSVFCMCWRTVTVCLQAARESLVMLQSAFLITVLEGVYIKRFLIKGQPRSRVCARGFARLLY